jgi:RAD51-like protein 1
MAAAGPAAAAWAPPPNTGAAAIAAAAAAAPPPPPPPPPPGLRDAPRRTSTSSSGVLADLPGLHPSVAHALAARGVRTVRDALASGVADLSERVGWSPEAAAAALAAVAAQRAPGSLSAAELLRLNADASQSSRVPLGLPGIDAALRGGLPPGLVTEVVGPPGAGKSQLCLQAAVAAAAPRGAGGLASTVLLLDAEGKFSSERLRQFALERYARECRDRPGAGPESLAARARELRRRAVEAAAAEAAAAEAAAAEGGRRSQGEGAQAAAASLAAQALSDQADAAEADAAECRTPEAAALATTDRVLLARVSSAAELERALAGLPERAARVSARLVVLDSIAALLRTDMDDDAPGAAAAATGAGGRWQGPPLAPLRERAEAVARHAAALKRCAEELRAPVLVTNQVTARPAGGAAAGGPDDAPSSSSSVAALGAKWAHAVNVRLALERWPGGRRTALVAKSPLCPPDAWEFRVAPGGLEQVGEAPLARVERAAHDAPLQQHHPS